MTVAACACGWSGVPHADRATRLSRPDRIECPACKATLGFVLGRNAPCWCGSGVKAKKCCG